MPRCSAISRLDSPRTSTSRTSSSRSVSRAGSLWGRCRTRWPAAATSRAAASGRDVLGVVPTAELRRLGLTLVPGFLHDRGDLGVGDEALPTLGIPVEERPDPVGLVGVAIDGRTLGTVLLALLGALGREDLDEAVVVLDLCRCQDH